MLRLHWACFFQEALPTLKGHDWLMRNVTLRLLTTAAVASTVIGQLDDLLEVCGFALSRQAVLVLHRLDSVHHGGAGGEENIQRLRPDWKTLLGINLNLNQEGKTLSDAGKASNEF